MIKEGSDDAERFGELVDVLLESELPFKESSLGGGEWQVNQYTLRTVLYTVHRSHVDMTSPDPYTSHCPLCLLPSEVL